MLPSRSAPFLFAAIGHFWHCFSGEDVVGAESQVTEPALGPK